MLSRTSLLHWTARLRVNLHQSSLGIATASPWSQPMRTLRHIACSCLAASYSSYEFNTPIAIRPILGSTTAMQRTQKLESASSVITPLLTLPVSIYVWQTCNTSSSQYLLFQLQISVGCSCWIFFICWFLSWNVMFFGEKVFFHSITATDYMIRLYLTELYHIFYCRNLSHLLTMFIFTLDMVDKKSHHRTS